MLLSSAAAKRRLPRQPSRWSSAERRTELRPLLGGVRPTVLDQRALGIEQKPPGAADR
jgi:hypothetical protein